MSKTYVGIKLQDLGLYNTLDPKDKIVIVKDKDEGVLQLKDFFLYVQSNLDLSNYYTSTQADTIFMAKVDAYTRKDADVKFALVEKTYTRMQSDTRFALAADTFTKAEIEGKYASKEQMYTKDLVYTKDEAITAFALKTEIPILPDLTPYSTTAKGDLRWALKVDVFSKTEADARFANINKYYTKTESDNKYALLSNTYTKAETDNKFLDTTEAYTKDYINLNIYTKTQVYTKAETDGKYPLKTDVYTVTAVNDQFAAKSWVYSRAEADNTFRKLADSYNRAEVNALIDSSKSGLSTDVSNTYYTKTDVDNKFELKGTAYNKIDSDAKYALISNSISPSQVASKYYNKTEIDKAFGDSATNTSNLFALKSAAVGGISLTPTNLTSTKVDGTSNIVTIPTWNQSTTGNAATATKLATPRAIGITGAVTAAGVNFDGTSNININATSLDATKLTGIVPNANINGLYSNVDILLNNNCTIYTANSNTGRTVYGLADYQLSNTLTGAIVFKTTIPSTSNTMLQLHISGMLYGEGVLDTIVKTYQYNGSLKVNGSRVSRGTVDVTTRLAATPDGYVCIILGDIVSSWYYPHVSITHALLSNVVNPDYVKGWTSYSVNDLTGYTMVTTPYTNDLSVANVAWGNVQNKPTTVSGYGITDTYTKTEVYTKAEADANFSYKLESIKSATLNTSTLSFTKADNTVTNIPIPTWNQNTSGNAATATKLQTPRVINGVSFDGSANITTPAYNYLYTIDNRAIKPANTTNRAITAAFSSLTGMNTGTVGIDYVDVLGFNSWDNESGGFVNALVFTKTGTPTLYHYSGPVGSNSWNWYKQIAYTDSNITGNAATASRWQTARAFNITGDATWSASVDGTSNITGALTLANTGVIPGTYTKVTIDSKGRATSASNLVPADVPNLDMSKVNTGVLGISQGGTGATTAATARTNLGLGTSAVLNVGAVNGVASLDASGKVPTSQLYINNTLTSTDTTVPLTAAQGKVLNDSIGTTNTNLQTLTNRLDTNYYLKSDVFTKTEITTNYFDKTYVNNNFLAQAANKDVSIAGFINAAKDLLFTTSLTGIKWNINTDIASIYFKNNSDVDTDSYLGFDVGDNGDEYFRWSFNASSNNKIAMSLRRDKLEVNNAVATLGLSTSATLTDISKIPQYGIYSKGNIKTDGQIITNATSHHDNISDLGVGADSPIRVPEYIVPQGGTGYIPFLHGSVVTAARGYTSHASLGIYRANDTWYDGGMYMAIGGDDRYPTVAFRFKLDGTIDFTGGGVSLAGNASSATKLQTARTISLTGDGSWSTSFDGTGNSTGSFVLSNSGVTAGTYTKVTVDGKGRVISGTGLVAGDIPALDTSKLTSGILPIARGGTGAVDAASVRNNLGLTAAATTAITTDKYTGVTGNVMRVGDFGFGGDALFQQQNGNFNDYKINAIYTVYGASNSPENKSNAWFNVITLAHNPNYSTQIASQMTDNTDIPYTYLRTQYGSSWKPWFKVALQGLDASFTSLQMTRPSSHISAPNVFIDTDGVLKKTSFAFGSAATKNVGTSDGDLMAVGSFGWGSSVSPLYGEDVKSYQIASGFFRYQDNTVNRPPKTGQYDTFGLRFPRHHMGYGGSLWLPYAVSDNKQIVYEANYGDQSVYHYIYTDQNTPNADITVNSLTVKNLTGATNNAPNLYYHTDGKLYKTNQPALLKSQADTYYSPINLTKLYAPDTRSTGHVKPNTIPVKALSVAFADINASFGINNGYPWGDVIVLNTWEEPSGGNPNAIITSRGGTQGIWHAYGPFNGSSWSSVKQIAYTDSNITGNAASATKLQTARSIGITGAVTATAANFDGTSNVNINATSLDATKLSGSIPNANINGTYSDVSLDISNGSMYSRRGNSLTAYGLGSIRNQGSGSNAAIVIKTPIPGALDIVFGMNLTGVTDSENSIIDITIVGWNRGNIAKLSLGTKDYDVRKATSSDGFLCFLISHPSGALGVSTAFSITSVHLNSDTNPNYLTNWTLSVTTDLSTFTNISNPFPQTTSTVKPDWSNVQSKPTTLAGYGITDAWSVTGSDNRYVMLNESRAISLNNTVTVRKISLARRNGGAGGINWYSENFTAWQDYMAPPGANNGYAGNITAPSGTLVTSWAKRSFIENDTGYGWTFEAGTANGTTPAVVAEINSSDGSARFAGTVKADGGFKFPNSTWNLVGDDCYIGDHDIAGRFCIKTVPGAAGNAGITFFNHDETRLGTLYSTANTFVFDKIIDTLAGSHIRSGGHLEVKNHSQTTGYGLALHPTYDASGLPTYGIAFAGIPKFGGHGNVAGDWATYFTTLGAGRGWIFKDMSLGNMASISRGGDATFNGFVKSASLNSSYVVLDGSTASFSTSTAMGIGYGRIQSFASIKINGNTDNSAGEYVLLTAGKGVTDNLADGFAVHPDRTTWFNTSTLDSAGNLTLNGYVSIPHLINRNSGYYGNNRHSFHTIPGAANGINAGNLLLSDDFSQSANVPFAGIWAKGDIMSGACIYSAGKVIAGTDITAGGNIVAQGDVTAFSDKRLKENIEPITDALSKVKQLNGVTYTRNDLEDREQRYIGLLAQDVQIVFPEAVKENNDGYLSLNYMGLVGSLVEAIKELDTKNQTLEARLAKLEEKLS